MAFNRPAMAQPREVIEILSDSDDDVLEVPRPHRPAADPLLRPDPLAAQDSNFDAEWVAIMAALEEDDGADAGTQLALAHTPEVIEPDAPRPMTEDQCLAKVLEIYPDISHDHVRTMFRDGLEVGMQADSTWCDQLIVRILDEGRYPTEREAQRAALKRKREPEEDDFEQDPLENGPYAARRVYQSAATNVLQNEYPEVPVKFIEQTLRCEHSFFKAFIHIEAAERTYSDTDRSRRPYKRVRRRDPKAIGSSPPGLEGAMTQAIQKVLRELTAAKKKVRDETTKREKEALRRLEEERNESEARSANAMTDCQCCFTEYPTNRMTYCNGEEVHFFCHECAQNYVNSQLATGRCRPKCMATTDCEADFSRAQLVAFLDPKEFDRLEKMQQKEDLRNAGIEGLEECPFCDYQAICEPVEVDREFRCPSCHEVSCRLCHLESHTPRTCDEAAKDRKCRARVDVENAMSEALIRVCNKCKNKFIKESGCNKMTCGSCGNTQCYVCSTNVTGYDHFHESAGKCPLYDNSDKRHQEEVKKAEAEAIAKIKEQHPDISEEELKVKVSDRVQQAEQKQIERAERAHHPPGLVPFLGPIPMQPRQPVIRGRMAAGVPGIPFFEPDQPQIGLPVGQLGQAPLDEQARALELPIFQRLAAGMNRVPPNEQAREHDFLFQRVHEHINRHQNELADELDRLRNVEHQNTERQNAERQNRPDNEHMNEFEREFRHAHGIEHLRHWPGRGR
ncbi:hypothetical protein SLS56_006688 [Neofusicoccum ribis]|uniref:RING-type domain-containing protein n=1 Tax=Neofusicoccum ribis TaxID=45134 RepID=A0ABR3SQL6_9PEZI